MFLATAVFEINNSKLLLDIRRYQTMRESTTEALPVTLKGSE